MFITASKLYDYIRCPHKVWRDVYGPQEEKIKENNPFVEMLWEKGVMHEKNIVSKLGTLVDISKVQYKDRFAATTEALTKKEPLIYQGVLISGDLMGVPDLLQLNRDGSYIPVDIKSGAGFEGVDEDEDEEGKPKKHYAVQLALYADVLSKLGFSEDRKGSIIDIHGEKVEYNFENPVTKTSKISLWEFYEQTRENVNKLIKNEAQNKPAIAGICKLCPWYKSCKKWCDLNDDLSGIFYLGRSKRDIINEDLGITKIIDFADVNIQEVLDVKKKDKKFLSGLAEKTLNKLVDRANIMRKLKKPVVYEKLNLPEVEYELFFDIEDDPTQEFVYMHGVYERHGNQERYIDFTATEISDKAEKDAWQSFWDYIHSLPEGNFTVYYYSHHEKTTYKRLQKKYPAVISETELEEFFSNPNVIDLYKVVFKSTDWPVGSYSLKELAVYLGFKWRDETPSGALSIQWYNEYLASKDAKIMERILQYNEDDCKATMVLKDALKRMSEELQVYKVIQATK